MSNKITGVQELLGEITEEPDAPGQRVVERTDEMFGMQRPSWGAPASLDSQDAASRLGIEMGEPTVKSASLRYALLYDEAASLEKLALLPQVMQAGKAVARAGSKAFQLGRKGGAKVNEGLKAVMKTTKPGAEIVEHGLGGASRKYFAGRRAASHAAKIEARAGRQAAHEAATAGMTPGRRLIADVGHSAKETARRAGGKGMTAGGVGMSAADFAGGTQDLRGDGRYGYGR